MSTGSTVWTPVPPGHRDAQTFAAPFVTVTVVLMGHVLAGEGQYAGAACADQPGQRARVGPSGRKPRAESNASSVIPPATSASAARNPPGAMVVPNGRASALAFELYFRTRPPAS